MQSPAPPPWGEVADTMGFPGEERGLHGIYASGDGGFCGVWRPQMAFFKASM